MDSRTTLPNLLCEEDNSSLREKKDENNGFCSVSESDCEFIEMLFETETSFQSDADADANSTSTERWWFESARPDIIKWILQKRAVFGYHYRTAYLSLVYFDRFLTRMQISEGQLMNLQLASIACFSLAAKMEESEARPLTDYEKEGYEFDKKSIKRMELLVLNTLEWRMSCVTPFTFFNYFAAKFCEECKDQELIIRANQLILSIMEEIDVAKHRPSIIAAAAVLAACDNHLSKAALGRRMDAVPLWGSVEKESTISCYSLLQEILELETPLSQNDNVVAVDDSTSISRGTRRRLSFDNGDDQDCWPPRKTSKE